MARKMKTMDGNQAAAHVSYAYTEVAAICRSMLTNGQQKAERISSDRQSTLLRCSLRQVRQVLYTDLWQQVL